MSYKEQFRNNPDLVKKLDKIKYIIYSVGGIDANTEIDFDVDLDDGGVYTLSVFVKVSIEFSGMIEDLFVVLNDTNSKMFKLFKKISFDEKLNLNRSYENNFAGGMITDLKYTMFEDILSYEIHYLIEI
jgi:hypothetical protein